MLRELETSKRQRLTDSQRLGEFALMCRSPRAEVSYYLGPAGVVRAALLHVWIAKDEDGESQPLKWRMGKRERS